MAQQLNFDSLPTEALFSFFGSLDPLLLGSYSTVCKKWNQMSKDNELWRQYCLERWDKNPKESDCVKNWLIPVREGRGTKENRIDWKRCYLLRSLFDRATKFMQLVPEKKQRLGFLKRKNAKKPAANNNDLFAKGWPVIDDLARFEKKIIAAITKIEMEEDEVDPGDAPDYKAIVDLFMEFELSILRQINISRIKYLGSAGRILEYTTPLLRNMPAYIPARLDDFASRFSKLAVEKEIPIEALLSTLEKLSLVFIDLVTNVLLPRESGVHLTNFLSVVVSNIAHVLQNSVKEWATEEFDERPSSPTQNFEAILHSIAIALETKQDIGFQLFLAATRLAVGHPETQKQAIPTLAVLAAIARGCSAFIAENGETVMQTYILPFWKSSTDAEYLVPALYFFSNFLGEIGETTIPIDYVSEILRPLFAMAQNENHNVQREVANFIVCYCANFGESDILNPFLNYMLDFLYRYCNSKNAAVRQGGIMAVSSLLITCHTEFMKAILTFFYDKQKDRMMTEFKKLLASGSTSDRKTVIEALTRIGAGVGEQKSAIEADIVTLYNQVVEDCKRDRDAHIDLLLKMTEFAIVVLGPKFYDYLPYVFPLVIESARAFEIQLKGTNDHEEENMDVEGDDDNEDMNEMHDVEVSRAAVERKDSAQASLYKMMVALDREQFLSVYEEIYAALQHTITNHAHNTYKSVQYAREILTLFIKQLFVKGDAEWCTTERMNQYWLNCSNMLLETMQDISSIQTKAHFVYSITQIFKHFCEVSTPSQPFLTKDFMQHFTEVTFDSLCTQYYEAEADLIPFHEIYDLGSEIIDLMEAMCIVRTDKALFWAFAEGVLLGIIEIFKMNGIDEYRWFDACLICTVFEHFGNEFTDDRLAILQLVSACHTVETPEMIQCLANHIGVKARKYPDLMTPKGNESMFEYVDSLLVNDRCHRVSAPSAYDNALMAMSGLVLHLAKLATTLDDVTQRDLMREKVVMRMMNLTRALPPAAGGDSIEATICIKQYCTILQMAPFCLEGENSTELKTDMIRALKETLEMPEYNTPELHEIVDPVLEKIQA